MAKVDIGTKRVCPECEAKFYDLGRNPAVCPMCQNSFDPSELDPNVVLPNAPLKPQTSKADDEDDDDIEDAVEVDEEDFDEEEQARRSSPVVRVMTMMRNLNLTASQLMRTKMKTPLLSLTMMPTHCRPAQKMTMMTQKK